MAAFHRCLGLARPGRPLVLLLDALDQLGPREDSSLDWLPRRLPPHVHLLASVLEEPGPLGACGRRAQANFPDGLLRLLPMADDEGAQLLDAWLSAAGRTLAPVQRQAVATGFAHCPRPLYLRLVFEQACRWHSFDGPGELARDLDGLLRATFAALALEARHGAVLVRRALGALAASRSGLSEGELLGVLSADPEVMADFRRRSPRSPAADHLPPVIWARLYYDLEPYLSERLADATTLLGFYHRQVGATAEGMFLVGAEKARAHGRLADHFSSQPLQAGPQLANLRKLAELPHQLTHAQRWDELEVLLAGGPFLEAKAEAGLVFDLAEDFRAAGEALPAERPRRRLLRLLEEALRGDIHFVARHPASLFQALWNRGWWYDHPETEAHLERPVPDAPWLRPGPRLWRLLEDWRAERRASGRARPWLRALRPPALALGTAQQAVLRGHRAGAQCLAVSPDGLQVASGGADGVVILWEAGTGRPRLAQQGLDQLPRCLAFTPDGSALAAGLSDGSVVVWDVSTGRELGRWKAHDGGVHALLSTPDGTLVSAGDDGALRFWEAPGGRALGEWRAHEKGAKALARGASGAVLVSGGEDGLVRCWELPGQAERWQRKFGAVAALATSPDEQFLAVAYAQPRDGGQSVALLHLADGSPVASLRGHSEGVNCLAFSPDGTRLLSGGEDRALRVWSAATPEELEQARVPVTPTAAWQVAAGEPLERWTPRGHYRGEPWARLPSGELAHIEDGKLQFFGPPGGPPVGEAALGELKVTCLVGLPDGRLAMGLEDGSVRVWRRGPAGELARWDGPRDRVRALACSRDGRWLASAGADGSVRVWDLRRGGLSACLRGPQGAIEALAFAADGNWLAAGASEAWLWDEPSWSGPLRPGERVLDDGTRVWTAASDWDAGAVLVGVLPGTEESVLSLARSPDGAWLAAGGIHGRLWVWDARSGELRHSLPGHAKSIMALAFSPDGLLLASGAHDNTVRLWVAATGEFRATLADAGMHSLRGLAFAPDGGLLVSAGDDGRPRTWCPTTGGLLRTTPRQTRRLEKIEFLPGGRLLVGAAGAEVQVWDADSGALARSWQAHPKESVTLALSGDGALLATAPDFAPGNVNLWDVATGAALGEVNLPQGRVRRLCFSRTGRRLAVALESGSLLLCDLGGGVARAREVARGPGRGGWVRGLCFSADDAELLVAREAGGVERWAAASISPRHRLAHDKPGARCLDFSQTGTDLVSAGADGVIYHWDGATGHLKGRLAGHTSPIHSARFHPTAPLVASGGRDGDLRVWQLPGGQCLATLGHPGERHSWLDWDAGGTRLLTAGWDGARAWPARGGQPPVLLPGHADTVNAAAFFPDGLRVLSASDDETLRTWDSAGGTAPLPLMGSDVLLDASAWTRDCGLVALPGHGAITVWDASAGRLLHRLTAENLATGVLAFSPSGRLLASAGWGDVQVWEVAGRRLLRELKRAPGQNCDVLAIARDESLLAAAWGTNARLWSLDTGQERADLPEHDSPITRLLFTPDGRHLLTETQSGAMRLWELATLTERAALVWHSAHRECAVLSPGGVLQANSTTTGEVPIWPGRAPGRAARPHGPPPEPVWLALAPDGTRLVGLGRGAGQVWHTGDGARLLNWQAPEEWLAEHHLASQGRHVLSVERGHGWTLWGLPQEKPLAHLPWREGDLTHLRRLPDGRWLGWMLAGRSVLLWGPAPLPAEPAQLDERAASLHSPADTHALAWLGMDGQALLWGPPLAPRHELSGHGQEVAQAVCSPDGRWLASTASTGLVVLWDVSRREPAHVWRWEGEEVLVLRFSPDGKHLLAGCRDGLLRTWGVEKGAATGWYRGHERPVYDARFVGPGPGLLAAFEDGRLCFWKAGASRALLHLRGHQGCVEALAFSPDGELLATGGRDRTIRLWCPLTGAARAVLSGHDDFVLGVGFNEDGTGLVSLGRDETLRFWELPGGTCQEVVELVEPAPAADERWRVRYQGLDVAIETAGGQEAAFHTADSRRLREHPLGGAWLLDQWGYLNFVKLEEELAGP